jgi:glutamyl-tRNA reductase
MIVNILGLNTHTASVQHREIFSSIQDNILENLNNCLSYTQASEIMILNTCFRFEIIGINTCPQAMLGWLHQTFSIPVTELESMTYQKQNDTAIKHLMKTASGLDSPLLGETQILSQLKTAYQQAQTANTIGTILHRILQSTFETAKCIHSQTAINQKTTSLASLIHQRISNNFDLDKQKLLFIGYGNIMQSILPYFTPYKNLTLMIANRSAITTTATSHCYTLDALPELLKDADIVISATLSRKPQITMEMLTSRTQPLLCIDLAIPRDIDPNVATLAACQLIHLDSLQKDVKKNKTHREKASSLADPIINKQSSECLQHINALDALQGLRDFRQHVEQLRDSSIAQAKKLLLEDHDPSVVIEETIHKLTLKLIHAPTKELRKAAIENRINVFEIAKRLFQLQPKKSES